jgi:hypothetical protein
MRVKLGMRRRGNQKTKRYYAENAEDAEGTEEDRKRGKAEG